MHNFAKLFSVIALAALTVWCFAACGGDPNGDPPGGSSADPYNPYTDPAITAAITEVRQALAGPGGETPDNPINLVVAMNLGNMTNSGYGGSYPSGWQLLLNEIRDTVRSVGGGYIEYKYVTLDLTACTMDGTTFYSGAGADELSGIVSLALPAAATGIEGDYWTRNLINLKSFSGANLRTIGYHAFYGCYSLDMESLPAGITNIGEEAFKECTNLQHLTALPADVTSIGEGAFRDCWNLNLASLPAGLTYIGDSAFYNCVELTLTLLPASVTYIGSDAFAQCRKIMLSALPPNITNIASGTFFNCWAMPLSALPAGITNIGVNAFTECTNAFSSGLALPAGLRSIGEQAFYRTNIPTISLPASLESIGYAAFVRSWIATVQLTVSCLAVTPPVVKEKYFDPEINYGDSYMDQFTELVFGDTFITAIRVPSASLAAYRTADGWKEYEGKILAIE